MIIFTLKWILSSPIAYKDTWLDSPSTAYPSLSDPHFTVSQRWHAGLIPKHIDRNTPVVLTIHGFSATPLEWKEFRHVAEATSPSILVSPILLGGHGRNLDAFRHSRWRDWRQPIIDEFHALRSIGFNNISIAASSTGVPLTLSMLVDIDDDVSSLKHFFFIDSFIESRRKSLWLAPYLRFLSSNFPAVIHRNDIQHKYWYTNTPVQSLAELQWLISYVNQTMGTIQLSESVTVDIFQATHDPISHPNGSMHMHMVLNRVNPGVSRYHAIDSQRHVFTQGIARSKNEWTNEDKIRQQNTFHYMIDVILSSYKQGDV